MDNMLFVALLLTASLPLAAEDELTLRDGRVLVGTYDKNGGKMTVTTGKSSAVIAVDKNDIARMRTIDRNTSETAQNNHQEKAQERDTGSNIKKSDDALNKLFEIDEKKIPITAEYNKRIEDINNELAIEIEKIKKLIISSIDCSDIVIDKNRNYTIDEMKAMIKVDNVNKWLKRLRKVRADTETREFYDLLRDHNWIDYVAIKGYPSWWGKFMQTHFASYKPEQVVRRIKDPSTDQ